jgi:hypothetical protein
MLNAGATFDEHAKTVMAIENSSIRANFQRARPPRLK